jgi:hypothetical protein
MVSLLRELAGSPLHVQCELTGHCGYKFPILSIMSAYAKRIKEHTTNPFNLGELPPSSEICEQNILSQSCCENTAAFVERDGAAGIYRLDCMLGFKGGAGRSLSCHCR